VLADFVASIALQKSEAEEQANGAGEKGRGASDRVTISTVHRAKVIIY
jgi:superfamily I DNA/RNA helicase